MKLGGVKRAVALTVASVATLGLALGTVAPANAVTTITWLTDNSEAAVKVEKATIAAFQKANPGIKVVMHTRGGGADADNLVKTKLATGTMEDVFNYNPGALLQALNPTKTLADLTKEPFQSNVYDSFKPSVTAGGKIYGAPWGGAMGGGIYYNLADFRRAGITSTPKTWAALMADAKTLKDKGITPICGTFGDSWTAQLFVLADYYNVQVAVPNFAKDYTANKMKYAKVPAALKSFQRLEDTYKAGLYNTDANTAKFQDGVDRVVSGQCAMYPMLTFVTSSLPAAQVNNVGFFAQPGDSASSYGLTTWMPMAMYVPKSTKHLAEAKKFVNFIASKAATDARVAAEGYLSPFLTKDQSPAPANAPQATKDLAALLKGKTSPALEFVSPIKGPNLLGICVQVATGQKTAAEGAALYDEDVVKQAQQLGIPGW
jgi:raffinose/stachyose/melibiose transport system substrate-binding protein